MISKKAELKLINIYMYICDLYDSGLKYYSHRYSNNNVPSFTDQKIMTIYLFAGYCRKYFEVKDMYSGFALLPSYQTFNLRLNRLNEYFKVLFKRLLDSSIPDDCDFNISLLTPSPLSPVEEQKDA